MGGRVVVWDAVTWHTRPNPSNCLGIGDNDEQFSLSVYDPLKTVSSLLKVLEKVQNVCQQEMRCFKRFQLAGPNIFRDITQEGDRWQTIIAYCGGWRKLENGKNVRCGRNPIFLGEDATCSSCGKLICCECDFCPKICSRYQKVKTEIFGLP